MQLINGTAISQREAGHALSRRNASHGQELRIQPRDVSGSSIALYFVVEINHTRIKRDYVADFINQHFQRVSYVERRSEGPGYLIQRVDFLVRALDLVVSHETNHAHVVWAISTSFKASGSRVSFGGNC